MEYRNYMEELATQVLDEILAKQKVPCKCARCRLDMVALALNNLPPAYCVTEAGCARTKMSAMETQFQADVARELTKAIQKVSESPRH